MTPKQKKQRQRSRYDCYVQEHRVRARKSNNVQVTTELITSHILLLRHGENYLLKVHLGLIMNAKLTREMHKQSEQEHHQHTTTTISI